MKNNMKTEIQKAKAQIDQIFANERARRENRENQIAQCNEMITAQEEAAAAAVRNNNSDAYHEAQDKIRFAELRKADIESFATGLTGEERQQILDLSNDALQKTARDVDKELKPLCEKIIEITTNYHDECFEFQQMMSACGFSVGSVTGTSASKYVAVGYDAQKRFRF